MRKVSITPIWTIRNEDGQTIPARLLDLLVQVQSHGSLAAACKQSGASYRHAWSLIQSGEAQLGHPLLEMARGKGAKLTPLGQTLVWAGLRIQARLGNTLESLASELEAEIERVLMAGSSVLRLHASHGFAIETLLQAMDDNGHTVERKYMGSQEAVASWHAGLCDAAGFHVPLGPFAAKAFEHYAKWLLPDSRIIHVTRRRQGFYVAKGNPLDLHHVRDLVKPGVRFVNRQASSGSRFLLECMLHDAGIAQRDIQGFDLNEYTHAAVAAYVASGMADIGFGVEPPARRFGLDFIPVATERYVLVAREQDLNRPGLQQALKVLQSTSYQTAVNALPGYKTQQCGWVQTVSEAFADILSA